MENEERPVDGNAVKGERACHAVVLFYLYQEIQQGHLDSVITAQTDLCTRLGMRGRVLVSDEGINGTVSSPDADVLDQYIAEVSKTPPFSEVQIDWKRSHSAVEPFPDLVVKRVAHLVAGAAGSTENGGVHLSPEEFHAVLESPPKELVVIDVRNTFEHAIGRFVAADGIAAIEPKMKSFGGFASFCDSHAEEFAGKKVLMYCTGGIRCEKASAMLRDRGVDDVGQLRGGIHRYLEKYPDGGHFEGLNFVFDKRRAIGPKEGARRVAGACEYCSAPFDQLDGARICTVCRDLVLVCPKCRPSELHCRQHAALRTCFFTFLDHFPPDELARQAQELRGVLDSMGPGSSRNQRRTISRQLDKVETRLALLESGATHVTAHVPRCRTCGLESVLCDGHCWGFWKESRANCFSEDDLEPRDAVAVGDRVRRGPGWGARYGQQDGGAGNLGSVVEIKGWGSTDAMDAVAVDWDVGGRNVYRFGVIAANGSRIYDVVRASE